MVMSRRVPISLAFAALLTSFAAAQSPPSKAAAEKAEYYDEPSFVVAGITGNAYGGGHGSDAVLRSAETLTKAAASLKGGSLAHSTSPASVHHALARDLLDKCRGSAVPW